jgi:hypothetical protein
MGMVQAPIEDLRFPRASIHRLEADGVRMFYREAGPSTLLSYCCFMVFQHRRFSIAN